MENNTRTEISIIPTKLGFPIYVANAENWEQRLRLAQAKFPQAGYVAVKDTIKREVLSA